MHNESGLISILREPLLQFLVLGALIFGVDAYRDAVTPPQDSRTVVLSAERVDAFRSDFAAREGHPPTEARVQDFIDNWAEREVLYRHAAALGLDRGDELIRRQMIRKMRYLLEDANPLPEPSETELRAWLAEHPERYGQAPTVSFEHVFIERSRTDGQAHAAELLARLRADAASPAELGDAFPGGERIRAADAATLAKRFGRDFGTALAGLPQGEWRGPIRSRLGWHLVRVFQRTPFEPATLESAGRRLRIDYRNHRREQANARAIAKLRARYDIRVEDRPG